MAIERFLRDCLRIAHLNRFLIQTDPLLSIQPDQEDFSFIQVRFPGD